MPPPSDTPGNTRRGTAGTVAGHNSTAGHISEPCGPHALSRTDILQTIAHAAGTNRWALPAPALPVKDLAAALDRYAFFPIIHDQLTMRIEGNACDGQQVFDRFGVTPTPFSQTGLS
jgi:hypothetical protein